MEKFKRHWTTFLIIIVVILGGMYYWYELKHTNSNAGSDVFDVIDCEYAPEINYWYTYGNVDDADYSKLTPDEMMNDMENRKQTNIYISCHEDGSGHFLKAYIFKGKKLLFSRDLYRGYFFRAVNNYFYTIQGIYNTDANGYPSGYTLEKFQYNEERDGIELIERTEYYTREKLNDLYKFIKEDNYNYTTEPDFVNATLESEVKSNDNKEIDCACEKTFNIQYPIEWSGQIISTFSSGEDLGIRRFDQTGKYKQFYVDASGMYDGDSGDFVRVRGKLIGMTCAYANTVFNECVGEVIADSIEKIK